MKPERVLLNTTGASKLFCVVLPAMLWGALAHNLNLGLWLVFLALCMGIFSVLEAKRNLLGVRAAPGPPVSAFVGEQALVPLDLAAGPRARAGLTVRLGEAQRELELAAGETRRVELAVPATRRGRLLPGPVEIASRHPFGLVEARTTAHPRFDGLVYPKPAMWVEPHTGRALAPSDFGTAPGPGSDDFKGLRAYQPGDPVGRIAWKRSSGGSGWFVKEFQGLYAESPLFDYHALSAKDPEQRLSMLCALILDAEEGRVPYGLVLPGCAIPLDRGPLHLERCLTALALLDPLGEGVDAASA